MTEILSVMLKEYTLNIEGDLSIKVKGKVLLEQRIQLVFSQKRILTGVRRDF